MPLLIDLILSLLSSSTYRGETFTFSQDLVNQRCTNSTAHYSIQSSSQHRSSLFTATDRFKLHLTSTGQLLVLSQLRTATTWHFWTGTAKWTSWHYNRPTRLYFPLWWTAMVTSLQHSVLSWLTPVAQASIQESCSKWNAAQLSPAYWEHDLLFDLLLYTFQKSVPKEHPKKMQQNRKPHQHPNRNRLFKHPPLRYSKHKQVLLDKTKKDFLRISNRWSRKTSLKTCTPCWAPTT